MDPAAYFRGKKVTVMGLGLLGRGVGDARYLAECGADVIVTDLKKRQELAASVAQLEGLPNVQFVLGEHRLEDFRGRDIILKAAGVPLDSVYVAEAKKHGIPVRMSADLFAELSGIPLVGITGTRGKTTVTHMLYSILEQAGMPAMLGGNIRGVSNLQLLREVTENHIGVFELDSWQLQGFGEVQKSPHITVFTTFYPDHLNYYKGDLDAYLHDKAQIFLYQSEEDTLIMGKQCAPTIIEKYGEDIHAKTLVADEYKLPDTWSLKLPGTHNRYNAALALAAARCLGVTDDVSREALAEFAGVPGRLEFVREVNGVKIYNDTTSTTPEATIAALAALGPAKTVIIAGGTDKNLELAALVQKLTDAKALVLLAGSGTDRLKENFTNSVIYDDLSKAVENAMTLVQPGDNLLFSPGFTSFGMFKNEYDRGDQFNALVNSL